MSRYITRGRNSWTARSGYIHQSTPHARFERIRSAPVFDRCVAFYCIAITAGTIGISLWETFG